MALTLTTTPQMLFSWSERDTQSSNRTILNQGDVRQTGLLSSGPSSGQANIIYDGIRTISSGAIQETLDLFSLTRSIFSGSFTTSFSGAAIKLLVVKNTQSGIGQELRLGATGLGAFTSPVGGSTGLPIPPRSTLPLYNPLLGWPCSTGQRYLQVYDLAGNGASYQILIAGAK